MAFRGEKSSLKRDRASTGDASGQKKPRRSARLSQLPPEAKTPLDPASKQLPSPLTHTASTATESFREGTATPTTEPQAPHGRPRTPSQPTSSPDTGRQASGLNSPPADTQPFSQFVLPSQSLSSEVFDEEKEGVWGYLLPVEGAFDETLVLRKRTACPTPYAKDEFGTTGCGRARGATNLASFDKEEENYENSRAQSGPPSGGYLIGRHPECDRTFNSPIISNRHCLLFSENMHGDAVAVLEDLSSNGTFVNEALVGRNKRRELQEGDEITILDDTRFIFRYPRSRSTNAFHKQYRLLQQLGKGHFATVFLAVEKTTGRRFAVKRFEKRPGDTTKSDNLQQEVAVLMSVSHPNLLCLRDTFDEDDGVYLVLELAPEGELFNWIVRHQKLTEDETRNVFIQLFQGLKYLHNRGIVHRDIKPENILLVDKHLTIKIADFGLAKIIGEESFTTTLCGTPSYVAPEILVNSRHRRYTRAVDIWSLGVVLYICLCGFPPFSDELHTPENPYNLSQQIKLARFDYPSPYWDSVGDPALDLIDRMLTVDPARRLTIEQCLAHPWVTRRPFDPNTMSAVAGAPPQGSDGDSRPPGLGDSADSLTGAMDRLDFSKRKVARERTLLSAINDVKVSCVVNEDGDTHEGGTAPADRAAQQGGCGGRPTAVKVFEKNAQPTRQTNHARNEGTIEADGVLSEEDEDDEETPTRNGKAKQAGKKTNGKGPEERPTEHRDPQEFIQMGGQGDEPLYGARGESNYP